MQEFLRLCHDAVEDAGAKELAAKMGLAHVSLLQRANPTDDPAKDQCAGLYRSCNARWGQGNQLPFGGLSRRVLDCPELTMRKQILSAIQAHAAEEYPREACGLLIGAGKAQQYVRCRNMASQPLEEFRLHPEDYAAAEDLGQVVAIVHSHPDATSRPSPHDLAMCEASGLPWHILSWPEGDLRTIAPAGNIPLLGRSFVHGAWDCWQVCADWYQREWGLEFERFERQDGWWEQADGPSLYEQCFEAAGFYQVRTPQRGDMIVFEIGRTFHPNHAGIYLGADAALPGEDSKVFGAGPFLLHYLYGKPSEVIVYGGNWHERVRLVLHHRESKTN